MDLEFGQDLEPQMSMKVSPRLVAASYILELSAQELQQVIAQELNENPALEIIEPQTCSVCGSALQGSICPVCLSKQKQDERPNEDGEYLEDYVPTQSLASPPDEDFDPLTQVASQMTIGEHLLLELQAILPERDLPIAEYLVGNLDENGYLQCSLEEVADYFGVDLKHVEGILAQLQTLEPIGIGARSLRECLLIQLNYLADQNITFPYAREIVSEHLTELAEHKFGQIASALGISTDKVAAASDWIKHHLNPYPSRGWSTSEPGTTQPANYVLPDVVINEVENGFEVEVVESKRFFLRITPVYRSLAATLEREPQQFTEDERRHIKQYVSRAKLFIANINQRRQTLHKITSAIVEEQKDFLRYGIRFLKPLTRAAVAARLGMHESTVSRATASKYVMLPSGQVIPFSNFFTASLSVMDVIKEMIENEETPLTDQEIADRLAERQIFIARRTVAKYREQLNILPSSLR